MVVAQAVALLATIECAQAVAREGPTSLAKTAGARVLGWLPAARGRPRALFQTTTNAIARPRRQLVRVEGVS